MKKRTWSVLLANITLASLMLVSCGKADQPPNNVPLPTPLINSITGDPTDLVRTGVDVEDLLTKDSPVITNENIFHLHQEFRVGEGRRMQDSYWEKNPVRRQSAPPQNDTRKRAGCRQSLRSE